VLYIGILKLTRKEHYDYQEKNITSACFLVGLANVSTATQHTIETAFVQVARARARNRREINN